MSASSFSTLGTLTAAIAASLTLIACEPGDESLAVPVPPAPSQVAAGATALAEQAVDAAGDAAITVAVNSALARDDLMNVWRIAVQTIDGHVVLNGVAPDADTHRRAAELTRTVQGVKTVRNSLVLRS